MRLAAAAFAVIATALPSSSLAATVELRGDGTLVYADTAGERNDLSVMPDRGDFSGFRPQGVWLRDIVAITPGQSCRRVLDDPTFAHCRLAPNARADSLEIRLGGGDDAVTFDNRIAMTPVLRGGPGDDALNGPRDSGSYFAGGTGDDAMVGGTEADIFDEESRPNGSDGMAGGSTADPNVTRQDTVVYSSRRDTVHADFAGDRDDGERGERDRIGSDVEVLMGGRGRDRLEGGPGDDRLIGGPGSDVLVGGPGNDDLWATSSTGPFPNVFPDTADVSADRLLGGPGMDQLAGSAGPDLLIGGPQADEIYAGRGRDRVRARDGAIDHVRCAGGNDRLRHDRLDFFRSDCERATKPFDGAVPYVLTANSSFSPQGTYPYGVVSVGCPGKRIGCRGSVQVELAGRVIGEGSFRGRWGANVEFPLDGSNWEAVYRSDPQVAVTVTSRGRRGVVRSVRVGAAKLGAPRAYW